jgi:DNA-binding protein YbaB
VPFVERRALDPAAIIARLEERQARFAAMATQTQEMAERLKELSVTVADPNGLVTVRVDANGSLTGIELSPRIQRTSPDVVSHTIMETLAEAKSRLLEQTGEVISDTIGADSETGKAVTQNLRERFGADETGAWQ